MNDETPFPHIPMRHERWIIEKNLKIIWKKRRGVKGLTNVAAAANDNRKEQIMLCEYNIFCCCRSIKTPQNASLFIFELIYFPSWHFNDFDNKKESRRLVV